MMNDKLPEVNSESQTLQIKIPRELLKRVNTHCEKISYKDCMAAKGKRSRRKPEKWYLVLNPTRPFLPVT